MERNEKGKKKRSIQLFGDGDPHGGIKKDGYSQPMNLVTDQYTL